MLNILCALILSIVPILTAHSQEFSSGTIVDGRTLKVVHLDDVINGVKAGTIVILSEIHNLKSHHDNQNIFLNNLTQNYDHISVGMEFFYYTDQDILNQYLDNLIDETTFLNLVKWKENYDFYRQQVLFPIDHGGRTIGLNAPKVLTNKISKYGLSALDKADWVLMPPDFTLGNESYFERFKEVMQNHIPEEKINNYFATQSVWDDTMAFQVSKYISANPEQLLLIIVGDFHVAYGGGLPDRLLSRTKNPILTVSQVNIINMNEKEIEELLTPSPKWGAVADYIWISEE